MAHSYTPPPKSPSGSGDPRSLGRLVSDATRDLTALVRDEIALAKTEIRDDVKHGIAGGAMFGAAGLLAVLAVILLSIAAAYGLVAAGLPRAWAFVVVAVVYLLVAGVLAFVGKRQVSKVKAPERAIETTKESVAALKGATSGSSAATPTAGTASPAVRETAGR